MKNILFINHSSTLHGAETVLIELLSSISERKDEFTVNVVWNRMNKYRTFFNKVSALPVDTITDVRFKFLGGSTFRNIAVFVYNLYACFVIISLIKKQKIDVVYTNTSVNPVGIICAILTGKKHIWHFHEPFDVAYGFTKATAKFYRMLLKYKNNTVVFISNHQKKDWENNLNMPIENYEVIFNPVKKIEIWEKSQELSKDVVFGFIGSLEERKNVPLLIHAFLQLTNEYSEKQLKLLIMGNGDEKENIKREIESLDVQKKIELLDYSANVASFYSNIDIYVLPSFSEMMPLVALEALSAKKALILTKNTGLNELLENNVDCIFINPLSQEDLYQAMKKLLLDTGYRKQLANNGFEKINKIDFNNQFNRSFFQLFNEK